jgi:hypothetical protein
LVQLSCLLQGRAALSKALLQRLLGRVAVAALGHAQVRGLLQRFEAPLLELLCADEARGVGNTKMSIVGIKKK